MPCDFPDATVANPIAFGMVSLDTTIQVTGSGDARRVSVTTTTSPFSLPSTAGAKIRSDLSVIAALTAASATQTGFKTGVGGGLTPYGAATDASYKSNPLDARITMIAANKADNDVWLRTDGGNSMHAPLRFDASDPLNRTIVGAFRLQNLAGEVLFLGAPSGVNPATTSKVIIDSDQEIIGSIRVRGSALIDNALTVSGSITSQGNIATAGSVNAGGNVVANGHLLAGGTVQAQIFYDSNNTSFYVDPSDTSVLNNVISNSISNNGTLESKGRVHAREYIAVGGVATKGAGCDTNGLIARDTTGKTLSCQLGIWKAPQGIGLTQQISGSCQPQRLSSQICSLADSSWFCTLTGVSGAGEEKDGYVYLSGKQWYMYTYRGAWPARYRWACFK